MLDVSGQGQSVGPIAQGFARWSDTVQVRGVVINRVASERHERLARSAVAMADLPVCGALMRQKGEALPERHLGLVQAREHGNLAGWLSDLADKAERELDLDAILEAAAPLVEQKADPVSLAEACIPPPANVLPWRMMLLFRFYMGIFLCFGEKWVRSWFRFLHWPIRRQIPLAMPVGYLGVSRTLCRPDCASRAF